MDPSATAIELREDKMDSLPEYLSVSSVLDIDTILDVAENSGRYTLVERTISNRYRKDYDSLEDPMQWSRFFDVSEWIIFGAFLAGRRVGGAIGAFRPPGLSLLENRTDWAALWDIRVEAKIRRSGVGTKLFRAIERWANQLGCTNLVVETQNTNVSACRFYERQGCLLRRVDHNAYTLLPEETQLVWSKALGA
jgi:GNAT superfamily N-acetyltransferase